ncbi:MAG: SurA N-terminal domain-containing protein, partial [Halanaerobiales bacterium]
MFNLLRNHSKIIVYIAAVTMVVSMGIGSYYFMGNSGSSAGNVSVDKENIARVNNTEISRQRYNSVLQNQANQMSQMSRSQIIPTRYNVLNSLIERELIMQEAERLGITAEVTDEEVEESIDNYLDRFDLTREELEEQATGEEFSMSDLREDFRKDVRNQKQLQNTLEQVQEDVEVSEEEIKNEYEAQHQNTGDDEESPEFEEVRKDIEEQLLQEKKNEQVEEWISELKEEAEIEIYDPVLSGYKALQDENHDRAVDIFATILEETSDPSVYSYLAEAYRGKEEMDKAIETLQEALEEYEDDWELHY